MFPVERQTVRVLRLFLRKNWWEMKTKVRHIVFIPMLSSEVYCNYINMILLILYIY